MFNRHTKAGFHTPQKAEFGNFQRKSWKNAFEPVSNQFTNN
jgi:hypothetical protein